MTDNDVWIWTDHNGNTHEHNSRSEAIAAALDDETPQIERTDLNPNKRHPHAPGFYNPWAHDDQGPEAA